MNFLRPTLLTLACLFSTHGMADDLPSLGDASSSIVSPEQEHRLGRAWLGLLRGQVGQLSDPQLKDYVETTVYRLAETSQVQDRRLEFILINSPQLNAFAAPGGIIGVNGGLFLNAKTEGEYASVLAHELAHLSQRHFARGIEAQQRMQVPVMAAMLAGIVMAAAGAGDAGIATIAGSQAAAIQEQRRFSRQNEQEADRIGILNLEKAGYDPRNMPTMFERLMRQYRFDAKPPEFLLTHPVSESRIADTRNRAEQAKPGGKEDSTLYQLMRARVALIYEETPGIAAKRFRAQLVENPDSDAARYGLAIAQIKGGQLNEARESLKPLLDKAPNDITYNLTQIDLDITNNRLADAQKRVDRMLTLYPGSYPLNDVRIDVLLKQNRTAEAEKALEALLKTRPDDPDIWYVVAETRGLNGNTIGLHQARAEYFALVGDFPQAIQQLDFAKRRAANNFQLASRIDARQKDLVEQERMVKDMMN
ncbi:MULTISPECIES: M48 family metalloprotease [Pseudomonas syringae group]|uniref:Putative beta-barrel assembly-enhancing protease n=4 Tax=Pseudomonas syringae group TaxID=136849 RepID=A0AAE6UQ82_9PSED|nr:MULTISPECIES: M48 family metalloprotease [Pseudomonas syringae group]KOP58356.1 peptidase M48 [Pseudomonas coronafaciens pv. porri]KOP59264.1 peptidase M48 [Pseudomonas coronafaciens pv. porri]KPB50789.1 TPR domain-containing protein [Pseudomonas coronafaciens pv. oryzae]KPX30273.1 TPR domain-containing protein [Pseudomonas coronafaciens pv. garcae]KPY20999.1 TPR domain-containing protein [Pseudomonas coronafaciens pv. porri]